MKYLRFSFLSLLMMGIFIAGSAMAQSNGAHFQKNSVRASIDNDGDLVVSWVEAGLGNYDVTYTLTAEVVANYYCVTNSGSIPNAANKFTYTDTPEANGTFEPKNGKVSGSLELLAPDPPPSNPPTCGNGQRLRLQSVTWSDVVLSDTTNGVTYDFGNQTFTRTFFPAP